MKIGKYGVLAGTMILGLLVLLSGCELGGEEPDYKIEFTVEGMGTYVFTAGYSDVIDDVAEGDQVPAEGKTRMAATKADDGLKEVSIKLMGTDTGDYTDLAGGTTIRFFTNIIGSAGFSHNDGTGTTFDLTISEYGPVGGVIRGTFSGQVKDNATSDLKNLTEGTFCIKRHADNSIIFM